MPRPTFTPRALELLHALAGCCIDADTLLTLAIPNRIIGVSHLTGVVLEERVALEACRAV